MADLSSYINITANTVVTSNLSASGNVVSNSVISTTGNITGNYILGNGSQLTGLPATYGNANVVANLAALGSNPVSTTGNITAGYILGNGSQLTGLPATYGNANVVANLAALGSNPVLTTSNITGGNLISSTTIFGNIDVVLGNTANALVAKTRIASFGGNSYIQTGNGTTGTTGNIIFSPYSDATSRVSIDTTSGNLSAAGNVTASNFIGNISITGNVTGTSANVSLVAGSYTMTFDNTGLLTIPSMGGDEGGEINFGIPATNTTLTTRVAVDVFQNKFRIFDGSTKGVYVDLSQAGSGVSTLLNNRVSGFVNAGTFVTMDLIKATVTTTGNRGLSLATTTGTFSYNIGGNFGMSGAGSGGQSFAGQTLTTTATTSIFGWGFLASGDLSTYVLTDTTNNRCYRITLQVGASFNNNAITIERLI